MTLTTKELDRQITEKKKDLDFSLTNDKPVMALCCVKELEALLTEKCNRCQSRNQVDLMARGY